MKRSVLITSLALSLAGIVGTADASFVFEDPANAQTVGINSVGRTVDATAGNIALAAFDALDNYTFTFGTPRTGVTNDNLPGFTRLTGGVSGVDLDASINASGGGYAVWSDGQSAAYTSSDDEALVTTRAEISIDITEGDVAAIAFMLNRSVSTANVKLFDADDNAIGDAAGYTIAGGTNYGFFGYQTTSGEAPIAKVTVTGLGGGQVGLDDVSYVIPEPGSMALLGLGAAAIFARRRRI